MLQISYNLVLVIFNINPFLAGKNLRQLSLHPTQPYNTEDLTHFAHFTREG